MERFETYTYMGDKVEILGYTKKTVYFRYKDTLNNDNCSHAKFKANSKKLKDRPVRKPDKIRNRTTKKVDVYRYGEYVETLSSVSSVQDNYDLNCNTIRKALNSGSMTRDGYSFKSKGYRVYKLYKNNMYIDTFTSKDSICRAIKISQSKVDLLAKGEAYKGYIIKIKED